MSNDLKSKMANIGLGEMEGIGIVALASNYNDGAVSRSNNPLTELLT